MLPSPETLRSLLRYEPETGRLFWRERPAEAFDNPDYAVRWNGRYADREALTALRTGGYKSGRILRGSFAAHRVIWAMVTGEWPEFIDHINGDRTDNRLQNLRSVTRRENMVNTCIRSDNKSGFMGVTPDRKSGRWRASISRTFAGRKIFRSLGLFDNVEDAANARRIAESEFGFHPNHGRPRQAAGSTP